MLILLERALDLFFIPPLGGCHEWTTKIGSETNTIIEDDMHTTDDKEREYESSVAASHQVTKNILLSFRIWTPGGQRPADKQALVR